MIFRKLIFLIALFFLLGACGDEEEVQNPPQTDDTEQGTVDDGTGDNTNDEATDDSMDDNADDTTGNATNGNTTGEAKYGFTDFSLDVDMDGDDDAIDVDYEVEANSIEASYKDKEQGIDLAGDEALQELDGIFSAFEFDENTPRDEVLQEVREAFQVNEDAKNVELEITFSSGTEIEYND